MVLHQFLKTIGKGITTVGLGTDGSASNNNADMLEEVRLATLHKARLYDPKAIPAQAAWNMGTVEGAKALGYTDLGVLAKAIVQISYYMTYLVCIGCPRYNGFSGTCILC